MGQVSQILELTDSSSALGWMHKASLYPVNEESHNTVSRWLERTLVSKYTSLYLQQIKGTEHIIANPLSRDFHRSDQTLTNKFNQILLTQTAASFHIKQPAWTVISWILLLAAASKLPMASTKERQPSSMATSIGDVH